MKSNDWKTECNLYYNVKQKKSFERVLEDKLKSQSHRDERLEYYKLLAGQESGSETLYGNHQTLRNMLPGDTIRNYSVKQAFGYDMWEWNQTNDGLYQGIKYYCNTGDEALCNLLTARSKKWIRQTARSPCEKMMCSIGMTAPAEQTGIRK